MKKIYTNPKIEIIRINSKDDTAAFAVGSAANVNLANIIKADSSAANIIKY
ncbi:MAG: hypothetical protein LUG66_02755 [Clostridiales bacterium]|nr:hypothetical protein [Clostridiales bacterium]